MKKFGALLLLLSATTLNAATIKGNVASDVISGLFNASVGVKRSDGEMSVKVLRVECELPDSKHNFAPYCWLSPGEGATLQANGLESNLIVAGLKAAGIAPAKGTDAIVYRATSIDCVQPDTGGENYLANCDIVP